MQVLGHTGLGKQLDQGLHCLLFCLRLFDVLIWLKSHYSNFRLITANFRVSEFVTATAREALPGSIYESFYKSGEIWAKKKKKIEK